MVQKVRGKYPDFTPPSGGKKGILRCRREGSKKQVDLRDDQRWDMAHYRVHVSLP